MNAAATPFPDSSISTYTSSSDSSWSKAPAGDSDSPSSFEDVLQQHDGTSSSGPKPATTPAIQSSTATPPSNDSKTGENGGPESDFAQESTTPTTTTTTAKTDAKSSGNTAPAMPTTATALAALIVQAKAQAPATTTGMRGTPATPTTKSSSTNSGAKTYSTTSGPGPAGASLSARLAAITDPGNAATRTDSISDDTDFSSMIAQLASLITKKQGSATTPITAATTGKTTDKSTNDPKAASTTTSTSDLSTVIAQAAILASNTPQAAATQAKTQVPAATSDNAATTAAVANEVAQAGKVFPLSTTGTPATTPTSKEKKSAALTSEGSFIQASTSSNTAGANSTVAPVTSPSSNTQSSGHKQVTSIDSIKNLASKPASNGTSGTTGTANVESGKAMSASPNISQVAALSDLGGNTPATLRPSDVNIVLGSNNDFDEALTHVMQIASLSETSGSQNPLRVAIEIQTPPGAIVNVYVSKQDDGYRAQLSTNDPAALSWVQDKISSLRDSNTDLGVNVKWLPAQMEGTTATVNAGNHSNLGWERNGQNQAQYQQQQQEDRSQSQQRQQQEQEAALADTDDDFMSTFVTLQGVA